MSEWISVKERLPEEQQRVIVRCERIGTSVGWILWGEWMTDIGPRAGTVSYTHLTLPTKRIALEQVPGEIDKVKGRKRAGEKS